MDLCVVVTFPDRESAEHVRRVARPQDTVIEHDNSTIRAGFPEAANTAARKGSDSVIVFFNPDGEPAPDFLDIIERAFDDPTVVAAEGDQGPAWDREPINERGDMEWLSGACLAIRREAFEKVGGFDERLFMYGDDVDISYKLQPLGRLVHCSDAHFKHDEGTRNFKAQHRVFRNWLVVQRRHRTADPIRMLRDALHAARQRQWLLAVARVTGTLDYAVRARRWA